MLNLSTFSLLSLFTDAVAVTLAGSIPDFATGLIQVEEGLDADFTNPNVVFELTEVVPIQLASTPYLIVSALAGAATWPLRTRRPGA